MEPKIFILSGPGGSGKTTLLNTLFRKKYFTKQFMRTVSFTTRPKRPQEKEGRDYFFVSKKEFLMLKKKGFFLESEKVVDDYYGTPKYFYMKANAEHKSLVLCIDVKGGMYLKKHLKIGRIVTIFISAPTRDELYKRLRVRAEKKDVIRKRLTLAKKELRFRRYYDYEVINKDIKKAVKDLETIFKA